MEVAVQNVLLIDDSEVDLFINQQVLRKDQFASRVERTHTGLEAIALLGQWADQPERCPDVILLDLFMPEMDGFAFLDAFEQLPEAVKNKASVFMLSSSLYKQDLQRAEAHPRILKFICKPLHCETMGEIRTLLSPKRE